MSVRMAVAFALTRFRFQPAVKVGENHSLWPCWSWLLGERPHVIATPMASVPRLPSTVCFYYHGDADPPPAPCTWHHWLHASILALSARVQQTSQTGRRLLAYPQTSWIPGCQLDEGVCGHVNYCYYYYNNTYFFHL